MILIIPVPYINGRHKVYKTHYNNTIMHYQNYSKIEKLLPFILETKQ